MFRRHPIWISIAFSALMLAVLGAAELAARRYAPMQGEPDYAQYLFESSGPFFRTEIVRGRQELIQVPRHRLFPHMQRFTLEKPAGLRRIIVIGESSAYALGSVMREAAERTGLSQRVEIINMAVSGSDLEQTMRRFYEALHCAPDALIVLFGHNLFRHHPVVEISPHPGVDRLRLLALKSRLVSLLAQYRNPRMQPGKFQNQDRCLAYRESLSTMADEARRRGVRLALCTVPSNLHFPPLAEESVRWAPEFLETKYLYLTGQKESAIRKCRQLLSRKPEPWWNFKLGEWLYQAGRYAQARRRLIAARDMDTWRQRTSSAVNGMIREVAWDKRLVLFDFDRMVSKSAPHGIPGWDNFKDNQHVLNSCVRIESAECLRVLGDVRGSQPSPIKFDDWRLKPEADILLPLLRMIPLDYESLRTALVYMAQAHLSHFLAGGEEALRTLHCRPEETALLLSYVGEAFWAAGRRARAMRLNDEARRLAPNENEFCLQRALFHLGSGEKTEAARWLRLALKLNPKQGEARFYLSKLEAEGSA